MSTDVEPEYMTPAEVARELKVSTQTVYRWCQDGRLLAQQFGGRNGTWRVMLPAKVPTDWRKEQTR
jgi:excisionase family DNA binding protein